MAFGALKGTWTFGANSIVANNQATLLTGSAVVARGDLIVVVIGEVVANTSASASDTLGNTYTAATAGTLGGGVSGRAFYTIVTNPGTNTNINVQATASSNNVAIVAASWEGSFSAVDKTPANNNNTDNASPFTCPATGTLTQQLEMIIAWMVDNTANAKTATSPNTITSQRNQTTVSTVVGYQTVNVTTTVSPAWTGTNPTGSQQGTISFMAAALPKNQYDWPNPNLGLPYAVQLRTSTCFTTLLPMPTPPEDSTPRAPHFTPQRTVKAFNTDHPYNINLYGGPPVVVVYPFKQTDWPNAQDPRQTNRSYGFVFPRVLIGQDKLPFRQMDWPLPVPQARQPQLVSWFDPVKLLLTVPFRQRDWPLGRGHLQPDRSYLFTFPKVLHGQDRLPIRQQDWPVPTPKPEGRSFIATFPKVLHGQDRLPVGKVITDRTALSRAQAFSWISAVNLALNQAPKPFSQSDWQLARGPQQTTRSWINAVNVALTPPVVAGDPFHQTDWPLPKGKPPLLQTWVNSLNLALLVAPGPKPFNQQDWPFPRDPRRLSSYIAPTNGLLLRPTPPIPYNQYIWPLPGRYPLLLQQSVFWEASLYQPPWVPPPGPPVGRTRQIVVGSEWQQYDRMRDWPGPVGWR